MEKRISYYVSNKNPLTWIVAAMVICSAVVRIVFYGGNAPVQSSTLWFQIILPAIAALWYAWILLHQGKYRLYRTSIPVFLMTITYGAAIKKSGMPTQFVLLFWFALVAYGILYCHIISGKTKRDWGLFFLFGGAIGYALYNAREVLHHFSWQAIYPYAADLLLFAGAFLSIFAIEIYHDDAYHPTWGDRTDGRRLRTIPAMNQVSPYIMVNRSGASTYFRDALEITEIEKYIRQKRKEGMPSFGIIHVFLSAYVRMVSQYPGVNRFLAGQKVYSRDEDIVFCMTVKKEMSIDSEETQVKIHLNPADTSKTVYEKLNAAWDEAKDTPLNSEFDVTAKILTLLPGFFLKFTIWFLKLLDYFGLIPPYLLEVSPFHGSIFFTSLGSLGIPPVYHHLYDFGNLPVFVAFGCKRKARELDENNEYVTRKYIDYTAVTDERIVDGFYYAKAFRYMRFMLTNPYQLDKPPAEVKHDIV